jgi:4-amino-4-deoxy-L-arabinose transferase-like glycosyltransferase
MVAEQPRQQDNGAVPEGDPEGKRAGSPADSDLAHIDVSADLPPDTRLRITLELLPSPGQERGITEAENRVEGEEGGSVYTVFVDPDEGINPETGRGRVKIRLPLSSVSASGAVTIHSRESAGWKGTLSSAAARLKSAWPFSLPATLFALAVGIYLIIRLVGLERFPIYFFTDEAVNTLLAADLLRDNFHNYAGDFLPAFFVNGGEYRLGTTVYLHLLPYVLFGKSVFVSRATSVFLTLAAAVVIAVLLRDVFKLRYWWVGVLVLSVMPVWFLHSRTAFESPAAVTFYALFLFFYLRYRYKNPADLYLALVFGALAFYAYSPFQLVVVITGGLLLLSDLRYHWEQRAYGFRAVAIAALLALPYLRFINAHSEANSVSLRAVDSYWLEPLTLPQKLSRFFAEYLKGLSPSYWFSPLQDELVRHIMKGYGFLGQASLPFFLIGLWVSVKSIRSSAHRAILIALLAAPAGAATVQLGVTRALGIVIPAAILTALGVEQALRWLEKWRLSPKLLALGAFAVLAFTNLFMFQDALANGPTWFTDYGMSGMQYGATKLFPAIEAVLQRNPGTRIVLTPQWTNGADVVTRFFLGDPLPVEIDSVEGYMLQRKPLDEDTLFVMIPEEYEKAVQSGKFTQIRVEQTLPYPNKKPGFYFVRMQYVPGIDKILAAERQQRSQLQETRLAYQGQQVLVRFPMLDIGEAAHLLDGDPNTLARTLEANPFVVEIEFPQPRTLQGLSVILGSTEAHLTVLLYEAPGLEPVKYEVDFHGGVAEPQSVLSFGRSVDASRLHLEVRDLHQAQPGHVHIWQIELQ